MTTLVIKSNQKPPQETVERLMKLKDEDIIYEEDCPQLTPKMESAIKKVIAHNKLRRFN